MKKFSSICLLFLLMTCRAYSQLANDVRSISMGSTSAASSYDISGLNQNPANIVFQRSNADSKYYLNIITNVKINLSGKFLSLGFYDNYFAKVPDGNTRELSEQDKADILNNASGEPTNLSASGMLLGFLLNTQKIGSFGFSLDEKFNGGFTVSKDFLELALYGTLKEQYDFSGTNLNAYWNRQLNFSYAKGFKMKGKSFFDEVSVGGSVKPQFGLYYLKTTTSNLKINIDLLNAVTGTGDIELKYAGLTDNNNFRYSLDNAGFGMGFDLGVGATKTLSKYVKMNLGLSVTDIGYIKWTKNTYKYSYDGDFILDDITNTAKLDSLRERIKGSKVAIPSFTEGLPTTLRVGMAFKIFDNARKDSLRLERATISVDYTQGITENLGAETKPAVGIGAEVNIGNIVSPRAGVVIGGRDDFTATFGIGIFAGPVIIDLGTFNVESVYNPRAATKLSGAVNLKFKIN